MNSIAISNQLSDIEVLAEKARVMGNDLTMNYFGENINSPKDFWKIAGEFYHAAGVKSDILLDFICDMQKQLEELQEQLLQEQLA